MKFLSSPSVARRCFVVLVLAGACACLMPAKGAAPNSTTSGVAQLEPFEVIGSRIKRLDHEGVAPVTTYTREDIEFTGFQTLGDLVRNLPRSEEHTSELQSHSF